MAKEVIKPYTSIYGTSLKEAKTKNRKEILESSLASLKKAKASVVKMKEEDAEDVAKSLDSVIGQVETAIKDAIDAVGATDPAVTTLVNTAGELEAQKSDADLQAEIEALADENSDTLTEAEDDDADEDDEDEDEDDKIEEAEGDSDEETDEAIGELSEEEGDDDEEDEEDDEDSEEDK